MKKTINDIPDENKNGNCYQVAYRYFMSNYFDNPNLRLVHGLVTGRSNIYGIIYNHAWVEDIKNNIVYDMTMPEVFQKVPKDVYYALGNIKTVFKYEHSQVIDNSIDFKTYGPWETELLNQEF